MIQKLEFYHGAAIVRVTEDPRCRSISKNHLGYVVNSESLILMKYTTKATSPWRFTLSADDLSKLEQGSEDYQKAVVALVCGGDGICPVDWRDLEYLTGNKPGWVSAKRMFNACYSVAGSFGTMKRKVALSHWPAILFDESRNGC